MNGVFWLAIAAVIFYVKNYDKMSYRAFVQRGEVYYNKHPEELFTGKIKHKDEYEGIRKNIKYGKGYKAKNADEL